MAELARSAVAFWLPAEAAVATQRCLVLDCRHLLQLADVLARGETPCVVGGGWARAALRFIATPFQGVW